MRALTGGVSANSRLAAVHSLQLLPGRPGLELDRHLGTAVLDGVLQVLVDLGVAPYRLPRGDERAAHRRFGVDPLPPHPDDPVHGRADGGHPLARIVLGGVRQGVELVAPRDGPAGLPGARLQSTARGGADGGPVRDGEAVDAGREDDEPLGVDAELVVGDPVEVGPAVRVGDVPQPCGLPARRRIGPADPLYQSSGPPVEFDGHLLDGDASRGLRRRRRGGRSVTAVGSTGPDGRNVTDGHRRRRQVAPRPAVDLLVVRFQARRSAVPGPPVVRSAVAGAPGTAGQPDGTARRCQPEFLVPC